MHASNRQIIIHISLQLLLFNICTTLVHRIYIIFLVLLLTQTLELHSAKDAKMYILHVVRSCLWWQHHKINYNYKIEKIYSHDFGTSIFSINQRMHYSLTFEAMRNISL